MMISNYRMSLYELLSLLVAAGGFISVVVSLYLLIKQTKIAQYNLREVLLSSLIDQEQEIDRLFVASPEMRKYFYDNIEVSKDNAIDYDRASAISECLLDYFATMIYNKNTNSNVFSLDRWERFMIDSFSNSPILRATIDEYKDWYPDQLYQIKQKAAINRSKALVITEQKDEVTEESQKQEVHKTTD